MPSKRLRDPSHGRCLTIEEWRTEISEAGFSISAVEILPKEIEFIPERMGADKATIAQLEAVVMGSSGALRAFFRPRQQGGKLYFSLDEGLVIARK